MSELPEGWVMVAVAEAGEVSLGRQRAPKYHHGDGMRPYLRVANVFEDRIDTSDIMEMHFSDQEFERYRLRSGDILLNEGQSPQFLGRPAIYHGYPPDIAFTNSLIRFRAYPGITPEWALIVFRHHMRSKRFMRESRITTNIAHLSAKRFSTVEFPVPPLSEQKRIVAAIEEQFSRIDAGDAALDRILQNLKLLGMAVINDAISSAQDDSTMTIALGDIIDPQRKIAYGVLVPGENVPDGKPFVRVGDLSNRRVDTGSLKRISESVAAKYPRTVLRGGEVLLSLVGTIGRTAVVPEELAGANVARALAIIPVRRDVDARYIALALSQSHVTAELMNLSHEVARKTLNLEDVRRYMVLLPPHHRQLAIVARIESAESWLSAVDQMVRSGARRSTRLRSAVLAAAFAGRLVSQDPDDQSPVGLLEGIVAARETPNGKKQLPTELARIKAQA